MKTEDITFDPAFYREKIDHSIPILNYHLGTYMQILEASGSPFNNTPDDYEMLEERIDGRENKYYPGDRIFQEIMNGERDPFEAGMLPYMRGWEWCLWVIPITWIKYIDKDLKLTWIDGKSIRVRDIKRDTHQLFGMLPAGCLLGDETNRFADGRWIHDELIKVFSENDVMDECTNIILGKALDGIWYFPDVIVILDDLNLHVQRHRTINQEKK